MVLSKARTVSHLCDMAFVQHLVHHLRQMAFCASSSQHHPLPVHNHRKASMRCNQLSLLYLHTSTAVHQPEKAGGRHRL